MTVRPRAAQYAGGITVAALTRGLALPSARRRIVAGFLLPAGLSAA